MQHQNAFEVFRDAIIIFLDIKVKEPTEESLTKKVRQYMDPKFMTVRDAAKQLVQIVDNKPETGKSIDNKKNLDNLVKIKSGLTAH